MKRIVTVTGEKVTPEDAEGGLEIQDRANGEAYIWTDSPVTVER